MGAAWMASELRELDLFAHDILLPTRGQQSPTLCDGGHIVPGLLHHLDDGERARLAARFFVREDWRSS